MRKRAYNYSEAPAHHHRPGWHRLVFRGRARDYTAGAVCFHLLGCLPVGGVCALLTWLTARKGEPAAIGQMVSLVFGMLMAWWLAGIALIRPQPKAWAAPPPGRARHAARYVFSEAMAMLTACGAVTAAHFGYSGLLGYSHAFLDGLAVCGAIWWGQAVGCLTLQASSRDRYHLYIAFGILGALALISLIGLFN
ncbi:MAG: hypothetical protein IJ461_03250 [Clostridia bacterium]|nr:hypothetical protein [Clostridia bacterium]